MLKFKIFTSQLRKKYLFLFEKVIFDIKLKTIFCEFDKSLKMNIFYKVDFFLIKVSNFKEI